VDAFILRFPRDAFGEAFGFAGEGFHVAFVWDVNADFN
jgi:hypothetical protein